MKKTVLALVIGLFILSFNQLKAQDSGMGLGVIIGEPTGLSFKTWTSENTAIDAAAAWSFVGDGHLHIHADFLRHSFGIFDLNNGQLPLYYGLGAKVVLANETVIGARIPIGLDYMFADAPLDIFFEVVPGLDLTPATDFAINGGLGIRYFF